MTSLDMLDGEVPRWRMWLVLVVIAGAGALWVLGRNGSEVPVTPQVVDVGMHDHSFTFEEEAPSLWPGRVVFRAHNEGDSDHELTLAELPDDVGSAQEWVNSDLRGFVPVYSTADRGPGEHAVFAVDLPAGHYGMLCTVTDEGEDTGHHRQGMVDDFWVGPSDERSGGDAPSSS